MNISKTEDYLLEGLVLFGLQRDEIIGIMLMLETETNYIEMIRFLQDNMECSEQEIIKEALRIRKSMKNRMKLEYY